MLASSTASPSLSGSASGQWRALQEAPEAGSSTWSEARHDVASRHEVGAACARGHCGHSEAAAQQVLQQGQGFQLRRAASTAQQR